MISNFAYLIKYNSWKMAEFQSFGLIEKSSLLYAVPNGSSCRMRQHFLQAPDWFVGGPSITLLIQPNDWAPIGIDLLYKPKCFQTRDMIYEPILGSSPNVFIMDMQNPKKVKPYFFLVKFNFFHFYFCNYFFY